MIRTYVDAGAISDGSLHLTGAEARHLGGSLRLRPGEEFVAVTPDAIEHRCRVIAATPAEVDAEVIGSAPSRTEPRLALRLCQAMLKGDQFERILEACTELGAASFQPLTTERTIPHLDATKTEARHRRWSEIVRGAAALGQRGAVPAVLPLATAANAVADALASGMQTLVLYEGRGIRSLSDVELREGGICLVVGPEGGWSDLEIAAMTAAGAAPVSLGPRIMRPLPAAIAAIAVLFDRAGELRLPEES